MYKQMTLPKAVSVYPFLLHLLPDEMLLDDSYIVRVDDSSGRMRIEFGYDSDEWEIK